MPTIRSRACDAPPKNWGPGVLNLPLTIFCTGGLPSANIQLTGAVWAPYDFAMYGWWYAIGTIAGGSSPQVDFEIMATKTTPGNSSFTATHSVLNATLIQISDYLDLSDNAYIRRRTSVAGSWIVGRASLRPGSALTTFGGITMGVVIKPFDGLGDANLAVT